MVKDAICSDGAVNTSVSCCHWASSAQFALMPLAIDAMTSFCVEPSALSDTMSVMLSCGT